METETTPQTGNTVFPELPDHYMGGPGQIKAVNLEDREVLHLISTQARDRGGDMVSAKGADVKDFKRNPLVLANHDYRIEAVIGRSLMLDVTKEGIWTRTKFLETDLAETALQLTAAKLGGWSIGFKPTDAHSIKGGASAGCKICKELFAELTEGKEPGDYIPGAWGMHFLGWQLLEYSSVAIPMNQEAVNNAVSKGWCKEALVPKFFITQESVKPEIVSAPAEANVELTVRPTPVSFDFGPAMQAISRCRSSLSRDEAAKQIQDIKRGL